VVLEAFAAFAALCGCIINIQKITSVERMWVCYSFSTITLFATRRITFAMFLDNLNYVSLSRVWRCDVPVLFIKSSIILDWNSVFCWISIIIVDVSSWFLVIISSKYWLDGIVAVAEDAAGMVAALWVMTCCGGGGGGGGGGGPGHINLCL
jgi:hypothetical protein